MALARRARDPATLENAGPRGYCTFVQSATSVRRRRQSDPLQAGGEEMRALFNCCPVSQRASGP